MLNGPKMGLIEGKNNYMRMCLKQIKSRKNSRVNISSAVSYPRAGGQTRNIQLQGTSQSQPQAY
jgi:hypothetical protein